MKALFRRVKVLLMLWRLKTPAFRCQAQAYFRAAPPEVIEWLQAYVDAKALGKRSKVETVFYALVVYPFLLTLLLMVIFYLVYLLTERFPVTLYMSTGGRTSVGDFLPLPEAEHLNDLFLYMFAQVQVVCALFWALSWVLFDRHRIYYACEALAISEHLTPMAIVYLLDRLDTERLSPLTPAIVKTLSCAQPLSFEDREVYQAAIPILGKHLLAVNDNLPLALTIARFLSEQGTHEAYSWLSLSINHPRVSGLGATPFQTHYLETAIPLMEAMERLYFQESTDAKRFLSLLPASYSMEMSEEKRFAVHALSYLLPRLKPEQAGFIRGDLQARMLRYLSSDVAHFSQLHLAIIDYISRAQMLEAVSALIDAARPSPKRDSYSPLRSQVSQAAKVVLDELEKRAAQKHLANTLMRAGAPDDDLLRASDQGAQTETAQLLLRKQAEE